MYYTYVLKSAVDQNLYIGFTSDLRKRIDEHNAGRVNSTNCRKPFDLVYYEACIDKSKALKREKYFKTGFGRRYLTSRM